MTGNRGAIEAGQGIHGGMNYGIAVLNGEPCGPVATIGATGLGRSGTTMLARIMEQTGLPMGAKLTRNTRENKALQVLIKAGDFAGFKSYCNVQNAITEKWGFKVPALRGSLSAYESMMRSPRFIIIFRDLLAIALRNNMALGSDLLTNMKASMTGYDNILRQLETLRAPIMLVSYEKALQFPERTVAAIADFLGIAIEPGRAREIASACIRNSDPAYFD